MNEFSELKHEYHFDNQDHFIETPFVKNESDAKKTVIDEGNFQKVYIEYSNGVKVLVLTEISNGKVSYYTNYPLKEISNNRFSFVIS